MTLWQYNYNLWRGTSGIFSHSALSFNYSFLGFRIFNYPVLGRPWIPAPY